MAALGLEAGTFVWYGNKGLGRVEKVDRSARVIFWANTKSGKAESVPPEMLEVLPGGEKAKPGYDGFRDWVKEAPLTLVAVALSECGGTEMVIKERLKGRALSSSGLGSWWKRVQPKLYNLPDYFQATETDDGIVYGLLPGVAVADVPTDAKVSMLPAWERWLGDTALDSPPEQFPKSEVSEALAKWPEDTIGRALMRLLWGANVLLKSPKKPAAAVASAWLNAIGTASLRWSDVYPGNNQLTKRSGKVLEELGRYIKETDRIPFRAGMLAESPDRQRQLERQRQEQEQQRARYEGRLAGQRQEQERQRADYEGRLERERREQERREAEHVAEVKGLRAELVGERNEQKRLHGLLDKANKEVAANRKESRLEIRQDMLQAVGEVLQTVALRKANSIDELAGNVEAGLMLALKKGEAELLTTVAEGKVVAPGVQVRGVVRDKDKEDGFKEVVKVLLKPQVKKEGG